MLKLMARLRKLKSTADNLIALQEHSVIADFSQLLNRHGFEFRKHVELPQSIGEIDLMLYHSRRPEELLIVEAKGVLGPDEVNEVDANTRTQQEGQSQLRRVIDALQDYSPEEKDRLWKRPDWARVSKIYGVVLTPGSAPNATYDHREFPAVAMAAVRDRFRSRDFKSPSQFWKACVEKEWLSEFQAAETHFQTIQVGSVKYEIPGSKRDLDASLKT